MVDMFYLLCRRFMKSNAIQAYMPIATTKRV